MHLQILYSDRANAISFISILLYEFCTVFKLIIDRFFVVHEAFVKISKDDRMSVIIASVIEYPIISCRSVFMTFSVSNTSANAITSFRRIEQSTLFALLYVQNNGSHLSNFSLKNMQYSSCNNRSSLLANETSEYT